MDFEARYDLAFTRNRGADKTVAAMDDSYEQIPDDFELQTELTLAELTVDELVAVCINPKARWC